jgi:hypothetical protein
MLARGIVRERADYPHQDALMEKFSQQPFAIEPSGLRIGQASTSSSEVQLLLKT